MVWLEFALSFFKFIIRIAKGGSFCQITILILFIISAVNGYVNYYLLKKDQAQPSKFDDSENIVEVNTEIKKALVDCGDLSFITWMVLENNASKHGKYLRFISVLGCDKDRTRFSEEGKFKCIIDIKFNNPEYLKEHFINTETLDFIESDPNLPNGTKFEELTPVWFSLIDEKGEDSKEAEFLKENTGKFWKIINNTNLRLGEIGAIKVRAKNEFGRPVVYIMSIAFMPQSERSCLRATEHLMIIAKKSIKGL